MGVRARAGLAGRDPRASLVLAAAVLLSLGVAGRSEAFEFTPFDPGSEVPVLAAPDVGQARAVPRSTSLPTLRAGTIGGRLAVQGIYERLGDRVYFETRRGDVAHDQSVAAEHPFEIDICFRDASGLPLFASIAGDRAMIEDCDPSQVSAQLAERPDLLTGFSRSYVAMRKATRAIEKAAFAAAFSWEKGELVHPARRAARMLKKRRPLERILPSPDDGNEEPQTPLPTPAPAEPTASAIEGMSGGAEEGAAFAPRAVAYWKHMLGVWTGRVFVTPFEHTATIAYTAYSFDRRFSWALFAWQSRNHGRHWYEAGMRHKCTYQSSFNRGPSIWHQQCGTIYNPTSIWGHNCNDDATLQIHSIKYNRPFNNVSGTPCNDGWANLFTPACLPNG